MSNQISDVSTGCHIGQKLTWVLENLVYSLFKLFEEEGDPGRGGGLQGTRPRAGQLGGGPDSRGLRVCLGVRPRHHISPLAYPHSFITHGLQVRDNKAGEELHSGLVKTARCETRGNYNLNFQTEKATLYICRCPEKSG
eukprot:6046373-Pyramimonas_sp.AAC.2